METFTTVIGYMACVCMVMGYMPQAIHTMRTRQTDAIATPTFLLMGLGSIFFVVQGIILGNWPLVITNVITTAASAIVFGIKIHNDLHRKKK
ncbi:MAG: hypothetical protein K2L49_02385 [Muribaculaceae bacterium]|nr:hypothetical protein [Muribaculaceae bacterium]